MALTLLGLGPGPMDMLTLEARRRLLSAQELYLRTSRHPVVNELPSNISLHSLAYKSVLVH